MNADGSDQQRLTNSPGRDGDAVWQSLLPAATQQPAATPVSFEDSGQRLGSAHSQDVSLGDTETSMLSSHAANYGRSTALGNPTRCG
jgi:hypothetical protein